MQRFGAYGKMPSLGDFFRIDAPNGFVVPWDTWMQRSLFEARAACADRWEALYMSAPLWRFSLSPSLAGPHTVFGVWMPSVDRVGRQFPLTLLAQTNRTDRDLLHFHLDATPVFEALEFIALDALDDAMTRETLSAELGRVAGMGYSRNTPVPHVLSQMHARLRHPSIWTAVFEDGPKVLVCEGLPGPAQVAAMFDPDAPFWASMPQISGDMI